MSDVSPVLSLSVSVRGLAEAVYRHGGLAAPLYGGSSGLQGILAGQRGVAWLAEQDGVEDLETERSLSGRFVDQELTLSLAGRFDARYKDSQGPALVEIKSFRGSPGRLPPEGDETHWAQLKLYAHLLQESENLPTLRLELLYVATDSEELVRHVRWESRKTLERFFADTCRRFLSFARSQARYRLARDEANRSARFPYSELRLGQKQMMRRVFDATIEHTPLFIQAPTGIGKTMATLYPAVKAQAHARIERIFYLTHITSTRDVAAKALADLRGSGFLIRSVVLYAKERLCLYPEHFCDERVCPAAQDYYERQPAALNELYRQPAIDPRVLLPVARRHRVCPFELSLDVARWCDVIVCDYNYVYDPRVRLARFFDEPGESMALLVDEAHNLPGRARDMYSAPLALSAFSRLIALLSSRRDGPPVADDGGLQAVVRQAVGQLDLLRHLLSGVLPALEGRETAWISRLDPDCDDRETVVTRDFLASRSLPRALLPPLFRLHGALADLLDALREWPGRREILLFWFDLAFFLRVASLYFDETYVFAVRQTTEGPLFALLCLDAVKPLTESLRGRFATIFFSATLRPLPFYLALLQSPAAPPPETLDLPSPFPSQNRLVLASDVCSLLYRQRAASYLPVARQILSATAQKKGNYLVFLPSYAYLRALQPVLEKQLSESGHEDCELLYQESGMTPQARRAFLGRFRSFGRHTLIGFSVLGSFFNEGIDLQGEQLIGVVVVGTGLPGISPERNLMGQYYQKKLDDGFRFAYVYPGFNRVLQAAGRLIRHERDRGFILLIDQRYRREDYQALLPAEWETIFVSDDEDLASRIAHFWSQSP